MDIKDWEMLRDLENLEMLMELEELERRERSLDLDTMDETDFQSHYHFNKASVETVIEMLSPKFDCISERVGNITPAEKICAALRFFATGELQTKVADFGKISQASSSRAINFVAESLAEQVKNLIKFPSKIETNDIAKRFEHQTGLPGVVGALDCLQVPILNPGGPQAEQYIFQKGSSLKVQTLNDDRLKIRNIVVRWPARTPSWHIFNHSRLRLILESNAISNSSHILGDNEYPIRPYLMTPISHPKNAAELRYNNAHQRAWSSVERMYGLWKGRFLCLSQKLRGSIRNSQAIICATAVLHNIAIDSGDIYESEPNFSGPCLIDNSASGIVESY